MKKPKGLILRIPEDIHKKIKMLCVENETNMQKWILELILKEIKNGKLKQKI